MIFVLCAIWKACLLLLSSKPVLSQPSNVIEEINCGDAKNGNIVSNGDKDAYSFTVKASPFRTITFDNCDSGYNNLDARLYQWYYTGSQWSNDNNDRYCDSNMGNPINPENVGTCSACSSSDASESWEIDLVPGDYYIEIQGYIDSGDYRLKMACNRYPTLSPTTALPTTTSPTTSPSTLAPTTSQPTTAYPTSNEILTCPTGSVQIGAMNSDISGCGIQNCAAKFAYATIDDCYVECKSNPNCISFNWSPIGGHDSLLYSTICTLYDTDVPTQTWGPNKILCGIIFTADTASPTTKSPTTASPTGGEGESQQKTTLNVENDGNITTNIYNDAGLAIDIIIIIVIAACLVVLVFVIVALVCSYRIRANKNMNVERNIKVEIVGNNGTLSISAANSDDDVIQDTNVENCGDTHDGTQGMCMQNVGEDDNDSSGEDLFLEAGKNQITAQTAGHCTNSRTPENPTVVNDEIQDEGDV